MYKCKLSKKLEKILTKLSKKQKVLYEAVLKKIEEILNSPDPQHYKNLSNVLKNYKRVHVDSHFVLIFEVDDNSKEINFEDIQHPDRIYNK